MRAARIRIGQFPAVTFCATANITGQNRTPPGRPAVSFTFAGDYIGGPRDRLGAHGLPGAVAGPRIQQDLTVEAAMAISGAAFASAMGAGLAFTKSSSRCPTPGSAPGCPTRTSWRSRLQNLRRLDNPRAAASRRLSYFAREVFGLHPGSGRMLLCTDGGHYDNLGLVEIRRRCERIYCIDASGAGPPLDDTLAAAIRLAREELGIEITLEDSPLDSCRRPGRAPPKDYSPS